MVGRMIFFIILLIFIFVFNVEDFKNLLNGYSEYIQKGFLNTCLFLLAIPLLVFDLEGDKGIIAIVILEVLYISAYTYFYLRIRKEKREEKAKRLYDLEAKASEEKIIALKEQSQNANEKNETEEKVRVGSFNDIEVKTSVVQRTTLKEQLQYEYEKQRNLTDLMNRFNNIKREYYLDKTNEKELSEITTKPLLYSLVLGKNRLGRLGLKLDEVVNCNSYYDDIQSPWYYMKKVENDRDEYGVRNRRSFVIRNIYKGNKCIHKRKGKEISVVSILGSKVNEDNACCPNCGYSGNISDFMIGCAACGTRFTLHDFGLKFTGYSLKQDKYCQIDNIIDTWGTGICKGLIEGYVTGFLVWTLVMVANALLNYPEWLEIIENIIFYIMKSAIPLLIVTIVLFTILHIIRNGYMEGCVENTDDMDKVCNIFKNTSFADFMQDMEYKLRNIHLADSAEQVDFYTKCSMKDIVPKYSDVISCDVVGLHFLEGGEDIDTYYVKTRATARLIRYYGSRIHIQHELIDFDVSGKKKAVDKPIRAMREYKCPNCANSLNLFEGVTCRYCGEAFDYADYDWMIESYSSRRKRDILPAAIKVIICVALIVTAVVSMVV